MSKQSRADLFLLMVALFWGFSYYFVDLSLQAVSVLTLNAIRFVIAFGIAFLFTFKRLVHINRATLKYSALLGALLSVVYIMANLGIKYTSLSNAGFLSAMAVVFTPIFALLIKKHVPGRRLVFCVALSFVGIALLTLNEQFKPALGDVFCIICAVGYSLHLLLTETAVQKEDVDAFQVGVYQLGFVGLFHIPLSLIFEKPALPTQLNVWIYILVLSIFCTGIAFVVQSIAQQYTTASHVGVIFTLEPVFAGFVAFYFAGEVLITRNYIGAALMIASLIILEWKPRSSDQKEISA